VRELGLQDTACQIRAAVAHLVEPTRAREIKRQIVCDLGSATCREAHSLRMLGLYRLAELGSEAPVVRYDYTQPCDLIHLNIKKRGRRFPQPGQRITYRHEQDSRGASCECFRVIGDPSRVAFCTLRPDGRCGSACRAALLQKAS